MPGLIMTHVPSELTRRTAPDFSETPHTQPATGTSFNCSSTRQSFNQPQMTISTATQPTQTATGLLHGGAACAMMSASSPSRISRPVERLRLREWLKKMIETQAIQGLHWIDKERQIVKIPWKHAARHGWSRDKDACLFRAWAIHTKKYDPTTDSPKANPKVWKANFRCAINSLPDIEELREKGKTKGNDAYKVYRLHPKKSKRQCRDTEGAKVTKRQRSTSKSRGNKIDKKQRKRNNLIIPSAENFNKLSDRSSVTKLSNASDDLAEDLLNKRMAEIRAAYSESPKSDRMRLNVQCVFKPNGSAASTVSSTSLLSPMSPPSTLQSPTTPVYPSSMSTNGHHFASPNYSTGMTHSSTCASPSSTTTSTPASTPQSPPPPPYHIVMNNRQGMTGFNMEARFEVSHHSQLGYGYDDLSDSDCSSGNMSEKEVANLVFELKDQSPGHSPRSVSPLDGNNNLDSVDYSPYWNHQRHHDNRTFFGNNCDIMAAQSSRPMTTDLSGYEPTPMMTQIKVEPETHPSLQTPQHNAMLNGFATPVGALGLPAQHQGAYAETSNYLLHQL